MKTRFLCIIVIAFSFFMSHASCLGASELLGYEQPIATFKFAGIHHRAKEGYHLNQDWIKFLKFTSFGLVYFFPFGLLGVGVADNLSATQDVLGFEGLNKASLELNETKLTSLSSYLGGEGQNLFISYLRATQTLRMPTGEMVRVTVLNEKDRINVDMVTAREVVTIFMKAWIQINKIPCPENLTENVAQFLRQFGYTVYSTRTLDLLQKESSKKNIDIENELTKSLYAEGILTANGQSYQEPDLGILSKVRRVMTKNHYSSIEIRRKLHHIGITDKETQLSLLHDLGYVGKEDLETLTIDQGLNLTKINPNFESEWRIQIKNLLKHHLTYEFNVQEALDTIILTSLIGTKRLKEYAHQKHLSMTASAQGAHLHLLHLALMDEMKKENLDQTFVDLDSLLIEIRGNVVKKFNLLNIQNKNFTILRLKGERLLEVGLAYIIGTGFMTTGVASVITTYYPVFTFYLSTALQQNITMALANLHYVAPWGLIGAGSALGALMTYKMIKHSLTYHDLKQGKSILAEDIAEIDRQLSGVPEGRERDKLKVQKLFDLADDYLIHKKEKLIFGNLEMDSLWLVISIAAIGFGVVAFLAMVGVVAAVAMPFVGMGVTLFFQTCFFIYAILYMYEKNLADDLLLSSKAMAVYKNLYQVAQDSDQSLTTEQHEFLDNCFSAIHKTLSMAKYSQAIQDIRSHLISDKAGDFNAIEDHLYDAYNYKMKLRYHAVKILKKQKKEGTDPNPLLLPLKKGALTYQRNELDQYNLNILAPKEAKLPLIKLRQVGEVEKKEIVLKRIDSNVDAYLMQVFAKSADIYNCAKKFDNDYQELYRHQERLKKYFNQDLTSNDVQELFMKHNFDNPEDLLMLYDGADGIKSGLKKIIANPISLKKILNKLGVIHSHIPVNASHTAELKEWQERYLQEISSIIKREESEQNHLAEYMEQFIVDTSKKGIFHQLMAPVKLFKPSYIRPLQKMPSLSVQDVPTLHFFFQKYVPATALL